MTEQEWLTSDDSGRMLEFAGRRWGAMGWHGISDRKLRLFACACCRQVWPRLTEPRSRKAVEVAERFADSLATEGELRNAQEGAFRASRHVRHSPETAAHDSSCMYPQEGDYNCVPFTTQAALLREIVGNPFRPVTLPAGPDCLKCHGTGTYWLTPTRGHDCPRCKGSGHQTCSWLTSQVLSLAQAAYEDRPGRKCPGQCSVLPNPPVGLRGKHLRWREGAGWHVCPDCHGTGRVEDGGLDPLRLMVLADALEEAGCEDEAILRHLHGEEVCPDCEGARSVRQNAGGYGYTVAPCRMCQRTGWVALRGPHVRGCWVLDLLLGKE